MDRNDEIIVLALLLLHPTLYRYYSNAPMYTTLRSISNRLARPSFSPTWIHHRSISQPSRVLSSPLKSSTPSPTTCPYCSVTLSPTTSPTPLCPSCQSLVPPPPPSTSHFNLFSLPSPNRYTIDLKSLKREFLKLQQQVHPDRFGAQGGEKESWAKLWSSRVNEAWKILSNDRERAEYLVRRVSLSR